MRVAIVFGAVALATLVAGQASTALAGGPAARSVSGVKSSAKSAVNHRAGFGFNPGADSSFNPKASPSFNPKASSRFNPDADSSLNATARPPISPEEQGPSAVRPGFVPHQRSVIIVSSPVYVVSSSCWVPGHWSYEWIPQVHVYHAWVPAQWSPDGTLTEGYYEPRLWDAGYYQPSWVEGSHTPC